MILECGAVLGPGDPASAPATVDARSRRAAGVGRRRRGAAPGRIGLADERGAGRSRRVVHPWC